MSNSLKSIIVYTLYMYNIYALIIKVTCICRFMIERAIESSRNEKCAALARLGTDFIIFSKVLSVIGPELFVLSI